MPWTVGSIRINRDVVSGISGPYLAYDTRDWGGGGTIANTGSGGSFYDLAVTTDMVTSPPRRYALNEILATPIDPWPDLGGAPSTAPFVYVVAVGDMEYLPSPSPGFPFGVDGNGAGEISFNATTGSGVGKFLQDANFFSDGTDSSEVEQFWNRVGTSNDPDNDFFSNSFTGTNGVFVAVLDCNTGVNQMYFNGASITGDPGYFSDPYMVSLPSDTYTDMRIFLGLDRDFSAAGGSGFRAAGTKWPGVYGMAFYRGTPTTSDLAAIQAIYA